MWWSEVRVILRKQPHNVTFFSGKYYVKSINYNDYTIWVVDSGIQEGDCYSIPHYVLPVLLNHFAGPKSKYTLTGWVKARQAISKIHQSSLTHPCPTVYIWGVACRKWGIPYFFSLHLYMHPYCCVQPTTNTSLSYMTFSVMSTTRTDHATVDLIKLLMS